MVFSSTPFIFLFLPIVLALYHIYFRGMRHAQNMLLLLASLLFFAWGEYPSEGWRFLPLCLMLGSIGMNYAFGLWVHRWKKLCRYLTTPIVTAVSCNLALLFIFKYLNFTVKSLNGLGLGLTVPGIELPVGISFFTFQALSYVLDVAMDKTEVQRSPLALGLYISFFPQLIAGPIVKYADVAYQIDNRKETWADFSAGCSRFLIGLGKKVLIANSVAKVADRVFAMDPGGISTPMAWLGALCYTFQIYYDFSGYSDMAIGLGKMFGFHFRENFDHPYAATSITNFWRRWHISLSSWFRDYVYIPLGGNRVKPLLHLRNLFVVWLLTGLWHGANWTFVVWGLCYFLLLTLEKYTRFSRRWITPLQRLYTLLCVNFLWVLFRSDTLEYAGQFILTMLGQNGIAQVESACVLWFRENLLILALALFFSFPLASRIREALEDFRPGGVDLPLLWDILYALALVGIGLLSCTYLVKETYNPFIYFRF